VAARWNDGPSCSARWSASWALFRPLGAAARVELRAATKRFALRVFDADHTEGRDMSAAESVVQRDVFGAPFFFVDGEPFWGNDRIEQIRRMAAARRLVRRNPWQA